MAFRKKTDALDYYFKSNVSGPALFAEDICNGSGAKRFHVTKPINIFNNIKENATSHFYEFWHRKQQLLFSLDLDIVGTDDGISVVCASIQSVIDGAKKYYKHTYRIKDVIVLESNSNNIQDNEKLSYHIIFRGLVFDNHIVAKDFFLRLKEDFKMEHCDGSIYNLTCFRLCYCAKKGSDNVLIPIQVDIRDSKTRVPTHGCDKDLFKFWRKTLITYIEEDERVIAKSEMLKSPASLKTTIDENKAQDIDKEELEKVMFQLPAEYYDNYTTWVAMGMILKNTDTGYFDLWDRWSSQSSKYGKSETKKVWDGFKDCDGNKLTIATLIKWCQDCGIVSVIKKKKTVKEHVESYPETPIQLDATNAVILNQAKLTPEIYQPYMDKKVIAVQSEKGTGKTSNLLTTLFENTEYITKDTSVLFVSSRRTFGIKLAGDIRQYGFKLYSDIKEYYIPHKRVICQVNSLMRLDREKYDLVIIDECESLARYITSSHFTKDPKAGIVVSALKMRVRDASHVYILDADLSERCINFYRNITQVEDGDFQLIVNEMKPYQEYTMKYMSYDDWMIKVISDARDNKKLVIPMASNGKAKDLYTKLTGDLPSKRILLIHKETSDEDKLEKLVNVNNTWDKLDILIYTPSVCMGVSFDVPGYFDGIYAYGCHMSLGAQEFCQMLHRIRAPKDKTIYVSMDYYKEYSKEEDRVSYQDVEEMMCSDYYLTHYDIHNNMIPKEVSRISHGDVIRRDIILKYPYKQDPIYDMYVRNNIEVIENKLNFTAAFFGYAKYKKYNLEYTSVEKDAELLSELKAIHKNRIDEEKTKALQGILEAADLSEDEYKQKIRTREEYLNDEDVFAIKRHNLKKCYTVTKDDITVDFVEKYNDRNMMKWYRNLSTILGSEDASTARRLDFLHRSRVNSLTINNCYQDFMIRNNYLFHFYALKVLEHMNIDINNLDTKVNVDTMKQCIEKFIEWAEDYKKDIALKFDLKIRNKVLMEMKPRGKINLINNIIQSMYGIKFTRKSNDYAITGIEVWDDMPREKKIIPIDIRENLEMDELDFLDEVNIDQLDEGIEQI